MERRKYIRQPVELPARLFALGHPALACTIRDFCLGGLFLACPELDEPERAAGARPVAQNDVVSIQFSIDTRGQRRRFEVKARVAGLFGGGLGVEFQDPSPEALHALQDLANRTQQARVREQRQRSGAGTASPETFDTARILAGCKERVTSYLDENVKGLFEVATRDLFVAARDARSNAEQTACLDAMKETEKVGGPIEAVFVGQVLEQMDNLGEGTMSKAADAEEPFSDELALVDSQAFNDWLTVKKIIEKTASRLKEHEYGLEQRLTRLLGAVMDQQSNPISALSLCSAFHESMQNLGVSHLARQAIFGGFEARVIGNLDGLLEELNELLAEEGVQPHVEHPKPSVSPRPKEAAPEPAPDAEPDEWESEAGSVQSQPWPDAAEAGTGGGYRYAAGVAGGYGGAGYEPTPGPGGPGHEAGAPHLFQGEFARARGGVARPSGAPVVGEGARPRAAPGMGSVSWPADAGPPVTGVAVSTLGETYTQPAGEAPVRAPRRSAYQTARRILGLQRAVLAGPGSEGATAVSSPGSAAEEGAGDYDTGEILEVLNSLQRGGDARLRDEAGRFDIRGRVTAELRSRYGDAYGKHLGREQSDALEVITNLFDAILTDPFISDPVKGRIQRLAVPLLKVAIQDEDFFGDEAHPARQLVNQLGRLDAAGGGEDAEDTVLRETVDPLLERILAEYEQDAGVFAEAARELDRVVTQREDEYRQNLEHVVEQCVEQQAVRKARRQRLPESTPQRDAPPEWQRWLERAKRLRPGESLLLREGSRAPRHVRLAWMDEERSNFVFVDVAGRKAASLSLNEVAMQLRRGTADVAYAADVPVLERGVYSMLHGLHEQVAREATHDRLTGLLNRKEFEERLDRALTRALRDRCEHTLCVLDLDHFAAIRERCGDTASEKLLQQLARVLRKHVGDKGFVARFDGDDFAALLEDCGPEDGFQLADRQRRAIHRSRCVWKGEVMPLSVSVGLVPVSAASESVQALLAAAREACVHARQAGGNRIEKAAAPAGQTGEVEVVSETLPISRYLEEGLLRLRCQRVQPIAESANAKPHYEILLGVRERQGNAPDTTEFVHAAERQNLMLEVDRWVIGSMLRWMAENRRKVSGVGGYSINLSGHSLSDETLIEYVLEQFSTTKVPPGKVVFEVTETAAIASLSTAADFIRVLKEYGCRFSLDDFGTGHATYSYLKTLTVDFVKIDGMFVRDICASENDFAMVKSINEIGHFMGKQTVAEYVETEAILQRLREIEVDFVQGFAIEKPMFLDELA